MSLAPATVLPVVVEQLEGDQGLSYARVTVGEAEVIVYQRLGDGGQRVGVVVDVEPGPMPTAVYVADGQAATANGY